MRQGKLRTLSDGKLAFYCNGCKQYHGINIDSNTSPNWEFNGDYDKPTFTPSILVSYPHPKGYSRDNPAPVEWQGELENFICHSFVTDGKIQYLNDCTHEYVGQTLELDIEED
jgi:hypothetical protein